jgi:hypothetical protein
LEEDYFRGLPVWLRWCLVIPAGLLVPLIAVSIFGALTRPWLADWLGSLIRVPGGAFVMVLLPALLATKARLAVASSFGALYIVIYIAIGSAVLGSTGALSGEGVWFWLLQVILALCAIGLACGLAWETDHNLRLVERAP